MQVGYQLIFKMSAPSGLLSAGIIEKDMHGDVLWVWSYPSVSNTQRALFLNKSCLTHGDDIIEMVYGQYGQNWYYIHTTAAQSSALEQVVGVSIVLVSRDFHPEQYASLCGILSRLYQRCGDPAVFLGSYLAVTTRGTCQDADNGKFTNKNFEQQAVYTAAPMKDVIAKFEIESILLMTAMLLKKRVIVYHPKVEVLLHDIRSLPALVHHRQDWAMLHPYVSLDTVELDDLKKSPHYVAGFTNAAVESRTDLYDLFVNLSVGEINIAPHAKDVFSMGKLHKDLALAMTTSASDAEKTNQQVIKDVAGKVGDLLNNLRSLATTGGQDGRPVISLDTLRERKMPAASENFLFNLAAAEGLVPT